MKRFDLTITWRVAAWTLGGGVVAAVGAGVLAGVTGGMTRAVLFRGLLVTVSLLIAAWVAARRATASGIDSILPTVATGATVGCLLDPASWDGRAYLAQLVLAPGMITAVLDLVIWVALTVAGTAVLLSGVTERLRGHRQQAGSYVG
ncbi:hypothetical protein [Leekyejoonella antrihumi]|uniref:Uncharacterized protein n=1 Tax=Leekyejoonella antrihumi TaxID=1660198 RepID=A0A563E194_9MICO|nr:hypothetical protein [Leekyejoonella antrihumi]TWP35942.1 hypothetical protein FGL98_11970 [Leekyejoonella antrihumi]